MQIQQEAKIVMAVIVFNLKREVLLRLGNRMEVLLVLNIIILLMINKARSENAMGLLISVGQQ